MKNQTAQLTAAMAKAKAEFAALVEAHLQTQLSHAAAVKAKAQPPRQSIHYRCR